MRKRLIALLVLIVSPALATAQPLVDRVPDDAFFYIGWAGTETLGPAYENSKYKKFLDASATEELLTKTLPAVLEKLTADNPANADNAKLAETVGRIALKRPCALYISCLRPADRKADDDDMPLRVGAVVQAGPDKDALVAALDALIKQVPEEEDVKLRVIAEGDVVAVVLGYDEKAAPLPAKPLGQSAAFTAARAHFVADQAMSMFIDVEAALHRVEEGLAAGGDEEAVAGFKRFVDAAGVRGLRRVVMSAGFIKDEWQTQTFYDAPAPRTGILKFLEPGPIDAALLGRMPGDVTSAAVVNFDLAGLVTTARDIVKAVSPDAGRVFQQGMGAISMSIGRRLDSELLAPLGGQWAIFASPSQGPKDIMSMVGVNKLDDAKLAKAAWADLYFAVANTVPNMVKRNGVDVSPLADDKAIPGSIVYSFKVSTIAAVPCFTIHNGYFYVGADPVVLVQAATAADSPKLTEQPKLADPLKQLEAPANLSGFRYSDLTSTAEETLRGVDETWPTLVDLARAEGIPLPARLLPGVEELRPLLGTAVAASWVDEKGFHTRERQPFPGSTAFGYLQVDEMATVGATAVGVAILLPSLNKARETANRVKCQSNLSQIGRAMLLYSNENKGNVPPDLGELLVTQDLTWQVFVCPSENTALPAELREKGAADLAKWVNEHSDFVYIKPPGKLTDVNADTPLVYEKIGDHRNDGINILYGDGHCEFHVMPAALEELKRAGVNEPVNADKGRKKKAPAAPARPDPAKEPGM